MKFRLGTLRAKAFLATVGKAWPELLSMDAPLGIDVTIEPVKARRSTEANALYWSVVSALASHVGFTKAELHEELLCDMHGYDLVEYRGTVKKRPRGRSHNLSRQDFSQLVEVAMRWCAEAGVAWEDAA